MRGQVVTVALAALTSLAAATNTCKQLAVNQVHTLAIYSPSTSEPVTAGQDHTIKWDATPGYSTVSILLLKGPSTNVLPAGCIVDSIPNTGTYTWKVPQSLQAQASGYGLQIIADGSGDFQYSMQFGVNACSGPECKPSGQSSSAYYITSTTTLPGGTTKTTAYYTSPRSSTHSVSSSVAPTTSASTAKSLSSPAVSTTISPISKPPHSQNETAVSQHTSSQYSSSLIGTVSHPPYHSSNRTGTGSLSYSRTVSPTKPITKPSSLQPVTSMAIVTQSNGAQPQTTVTASLSGGSEGASSTATGGAAARATGVAIGAFVGAMGAVAGLVL